MLNTFESYLDIEEVRVICAGLNSLKHRISNVDFDDAFLEYNTCEKYFDIIREMAVNIHDEALANAQMIYMHYFKFFTYFVCYYNCLKNKEYAKSWFGLQDCIDEAKLVGEFVEIEYRREIPKMVDLLLQYEKLYPYKIFASSEYIISKSHCSICGKSMQSLACQHRKGKLYWGEFAREVIEEIREVQAVCLVSHPENKRCIMELQEYKDMPELEKFKKLDEFMKLNINPLQTFEMQTKIERRKDSSFQKINRNDMCTCGSGKKFKRCCINNMYYEHERNIISPLSGIDLEF